MTSQDNARRARAEGSTRLVLQSRAVRAACLSGCCALACLLALAPTPARADGCSMTSMSFDATTEGCPKATRTVWYLCGATTPHWSVTEGLHDYSEEYPSCPWYDPPSPPPPPESCTCGYEGDEEIPSSCVLVGDPVAAGTGLFMTEPAIDVRYGGAHVPLELVRYYTSREPWLPPTMENDFATERTRLAVGWTTTFDERLFDESAQAVIPTLVAEEEDDLIVVHRLPSGRGRRFHCAAPYDPASAFDCTTTDSSLDVLSWAPGTPSAWRLLSVADRTVTTFSESGRLLRKENPSGTEYWEVAYDGQGFLDIAEDHLGRVLRFEYEEIEEGEQRLASVWDAASEGNQLVEYGHDALLHLTSASSTTASEAYGYAATFDGHALPYLTSITRDGDVVTAITYDNDDATTPGMGRVTLLDGWNGVFAFRYAGAEDNLCPEPADSTMVIDMATDPLPEVTCDEDSDCEPPTGSIYSCDIAAGECRAARCLQFFDTGTMLDTSAPVAILGNCDCGGEEYTYTEPEGEGWREVETATSRRGLVTSFAHDSSGRVTARCEGDSDDEVIAGTPASCPSTGTYTEWEYTDFTWRTSATAEIRRSRLDDTNLVGTTYTYDATSGNVLEIERTGYSEELDGDPVLQVETVTYTYDADDRIESITGPATEYTEYEYWGSGQGANTGMLRYARHRVDDTPTYLVTEYSDYTTLGHPETIERPEGTTTLVWTGHRLDEITVGGRTTELNYDAGGRLASIEYPSGVIEAHGYDAHGRLATIDRYSANSTEMDRVLYEFDDAGRRTLVSLRRVELDGDLVAEAGRYEATYEASGFIASTTLGPQDPETRVYDPDGSGDLDQIIRGDGDEVDLVTDAFGRETMLTRHFTGMTSGDHEASFANPSGFETSAALPTSVTDPESRTRTYVFDDFDRLVSSTSEEYGTQRWEWSDGRVVSTRYNSEYPTVYTHDDLGRVIEMDNNAGAAVVGPDYLFEYENVAETPECGMVFSSCTARVGRLARVGVERVYETFDWFEYDYAPDGRVIGEQYPDGREIAYEYESTEGRLVRRRFPELDGASVHDFTRWDYDTAANGQHSEDVIAIHHELTSGTSLFAWADEMLTDAAGRVTRAHLHSHGSGTYATASYRTDGRADTWNVPRRTGSSTYVDAMDREYVYSLDGSSTGWATSCADDEDRTFMYDGGNRLVCVTDEASSTTCPSGTSSPLLEAFTYDESDSRTGYRDPSGTTTYTLDGAAIIEEDPPGAFEIEQIYEFTDGGARIEDGDTGIAEATREFFYDGLRRLRTVTLKRPTETEDEYDDVTITVHYDHRARPYLVSVFNEDTEVEDRSRYYYDLEDRVIAWMRTPDMSTAGTFEFRQYVHIGDFAVGEMARSWVSGSATRHTYFHTTEPLGLETAAFEFEHSGGASVSYNPSTVVRQWTAFGRPLVATGAGVALPTRFPGQIELRGSDVRVWDDSSVVAHRDGLYLNRWRAYDPRVGQYLQPDPQAIESARTREHVFQYAMAAPGDLSDPLGREACGDRDGSGGGWVPAFDEGGGGGGGFRLPPEQCIALCNTLTEVSGLTGADGLIFRVACLMWCLSVGS